MQKWKISRLWKKWRQNYQKKSSKTLFGTGSQDSFYVTKNNCHHKNWLFLLQRGNCQWHGVFCAFFYFILQLINFFIVKTKNLKIKRYFKNCIIKNNDLQPFQKCHIFEEFFFWSVECPEVIFQDNLGFLDKYCSWNSYIDLNEL